jgi:hypothetical protein
MQANGVVDRLNGVGLPSRIAPFRTGDAPGKGFGFGAPGLKLPPMPPLGARPAPRVLAIACHALRAGAGLDAVQVSARGYGLLFGAGGLFLVWGTFERVLLRRFTRPRARFVFAGLHGVATARALLGPAVRLVSPAPGPISLPALAPGGVPRAPSTIVPVGTHRVRLDLAPFCVPDASELDPSGSGKERP